MSLSGFKVKGLINLPDDLERMKKTDQYGEFEVFFSTEKPTDPVISVVLSVYNGDGHLHESIASILNQTYGSIELIVINDGSTDGTYEIIRKNQQEDPRIVSVLQPNLGLTKSLNRGIQLAKGTYIARQDADDLSVPTRFEKQSTYLNIHPDYTLVGSAYQEITNGSKFPQSIRFVQSDDEIRKAICKYNPICHPSIMMRKRTLGEVGGYNDRFQYSQDYELYGRLLKNYKLCNLPEILILRHIHDSIISKTFEKSQCYYAIRAKISAMKFLGKSWMYIFYVHRELLIILLPKFLMGFIRQFRLRKSQKQIDQR